VVRLSEPSKDTLDISCIILAGGKGSRLGYNKAQLAIGGKSLLQLAISRISFLKGEVIVVTGASKMVSGQSGQPGYKVVTDVYPDKGPLIGIYTGLTVAESSYSLVVGCDMPFLNRALLSYMVQVAPGFDVVIPRLGELVEPLHAIYSKSCLAPIESMIEQDNLGIHGLLNLVEVRYVDSNDIDRFDPEHQSFFNVNTPAELDIVQGMVNQGEFIGDKS
jgi:molybdopterin-guanine dinucleotide biosynthesis protein A